MKPFNCVQKNELRLKRMYLQNELTNYSLYVKIVFGIK